ncbi:glyoxalase [Blautia schinkii]|uniref:glyoxalase n=1 Tax=Blautia schinkii TaxID=180164 RepID=UPI00156D5C4A|nr:glyoxalase [Blautia schinkii]NSG83531.1 glyoxalase [Blautia schinkii]NSK24139.1 glyoxalase [Blautia schinkii]NSK27176.1 glyoxalase [Blautia schinkii]NSK33630.1 glyoxalase [Blautia schinkii]NSK49636.1 glyoxalase [Blautia schinkii]
MYKKEYVETFLKNQGRLFDESVADDFEEAEAFLEDCMAVVLDSLKDVKKYLDGMGADVEGLSFKELEEESEVFKLPDGKYLIVEG